jgi:hypothetical protein
VAMQSASSPREAEVATEVICHCSIERWSRGVCLVSH